MSRSTTFETSFFHGLNAFVEPLVRIGWGAPWLVPTGLIALETVGRRSGRAHRVPLLATEVGEHLLVSTVRVGRSEWLENIRRTPDVRYWLRGRAREGSALVFDSGGEPPADAQDLPPLVRTMASGLSTACGLRLAVAVLTPRV